MTRIALLAALLVACHRGDSGPPCDKVVDHMQELMKQAMPGHDEAALGNRQQLIDSCVKRKMSQKVRQCLLDAKSFNDLSACSTQQQKTTTPTPPPITPVPPAPSTAGSGSAAPTPAPAGSAAPPVTPTPVTPTPEPTRPLPTGGGTPDKSG